MSEEVPSIRPRVSLRQCDAIDYAQGVLHALRVALDVLCGPGARREVLIEALEKRATELCSDCGLPGGLACEQLAELLRADAE